MASVEATPAISLEKFISYLDFRETNSAHKIYTMIDWNRMADVADEHGVDSAEFRGAMRHELTLARSKNDFQSMVTENFESPKSNGERFSNWLSYALSRGKS